MNLALADGKVRRRGIDRFNLRPAKAKGTDGDLIFTRLGFGW
jgi:hypothetical protein